MAKGSSSNQKEIVKEEILEQLEGKKWEKSRQSLKCE